MFKPTEWEKWLLDQPCSYYKRLNLPENCLDTEIPSVAMKVIIYKLMDRIEALEEEMETKENRKVRLR